MIFPILRETEILLVDVDILWFSLHWKSEFNFKQEWSCGEKSEEENFFLYRKRGRDMEIYFVKIPTDLMEKSKWEGIKINIVNDKPKFLFNADLLSEICFRIIQQYAEKLNQLKHEK